MVDHGLQSLTWMTGLHQKIMAADAAPERKNS